MNLHLHGVPRLDTENLCTLGVQSWGHHHVGHQEFAPARCSWDTVWLQIICVLTGHRAEVNYWCPALGH